MKNILLLAVLFVSVFAFSCGDDEANIDLTEGLLGVYKDTVDGKTSLTVSRKEGNIIVISNTVGSAIIDKPVEALVRSRTSLGADTLFLTNRGGNLFFETHPRKKRLAMYFQYTTEDIFVGIKE